MTYQAPSYLLSNEPLRSARYLDSDNGKYRLTLDPHGNLAVNHLPIGGHAPVWRNFQSSQTNGTSSYAMLGMNGVLTILNGTELTPGDFIWDNQDQSTFLPAAPGKSILKLGNDGNLAIYACSSPDAIDQRTILWSSESGDGLNPYHTFVRQDPCSLSGFWMMKCKDPDSYQYAFGYQNSSLSFRQQIDDYCLLEPHAVGSAVQGQAGFFALSYNQVSFSKVSTDKKTTQYFRNKDDHFDTTSNIDEACRFLVEYDQLHPDDFCISSWTPDGNFLGYWDADNPSDGSTVTLCHPDKKRYNLSMVCRFPTPGMEVSQPIAGDVQLKNKEYDSTRQSVLINGESDLGFVFDSSRRKSDFSWWDIHWEANWKMAQIGGCSNGPWTSLTPVAFNDESPSVRSTPMKLYGSSPQSTYLLGNGLGSFNLTTQIEEPALMNGDWLISGVGATGNQVITCQDGYMISSPERSIYNSNVDDRCAFGITVRDDLHMEILENPVASGSSIVDLAFQDGSKIVVSETGIGKQYLQADHSPETGTAFIFAPEPNNIFSLQVLGSREWVKWEASTQKYLTVNDFNERSFFQLKVRYGPDACPQRGEVLTSPVEGFKGNWQTIDSDLENFTMFKTGGAIPVESVQVGPQTLCWLYQNTNYSGKAVSVTSGFSSYYDNEGYPLSFQSAKVAKLKSPYQSGITMVSKLMTDYVWNGSNKSYAETENTWRVTLTYRNPQGTGYAGEKMRVSAAASLSFTSKGSEYQINPSEADHKSVLLSPDPSGNLILNIAAPTDEVSPPSLLVALEGDDDNVWTLLEPSEPLLKSMKGISANEVQNGFGGAGDDGNASRGGLADGDQPLSDVQSQGVADFCNVMGGSIPVDNGNAYPMGTGIGARVRNNQQNEASDGMMQAAFSKEYSMLDKHVVFKLDTKEKIESCHCESFHDGLTELTRDFEPHQIETVAVGITPKQLNALVSWRNIKGFFVSGFKKAIHGLEEFGKWVYSGVKAIVSWIDEKTGILKLAHLIIETVEHVLTFVTEVFLAIALFTVTALLAFFSFVFNWQPVLDMQKRVSDTLDGNFSNLRNLLVNYGPQQLQNVMDKGQDILTAIDEVIAKCGYRSEDVANLETDDWPASLPHEDNMSQARSVPNDNWLMDKVQASSDDWPVEDVAMDNFVGLFEGFHEQIFSARDEEPSEAQIQEFCDEYNDAMKQIEAKGGRSNCLNYLVGEVLYIVRSLIQAAMSGMQWVMDRIFEMIDNLLERFSEIMNHEIDLGPFNYLYGIITRDSTDSDQRILTIKNLVCFALAIPLVVEESIRSLFSKKEPSDKMVLAYEDDEFLKSISIFGSALSAIMAPIRDTFEAEMLTLGSAAEPNLAAIKRSKNTIGIFNAFTVISRGIGTTYPFASWAERGTPTDPMSIAPLFARGLGVLSPVFGYSVIVTTPAGATKNVAAVGPFLQCMTGLFSIAAIGDAIYTATTNGTHVSNKQIVFTVASTAAGLENCLKGATGVAYLLRTPAITEYVLIGDVILSATIVGCDITVAFMD